MELDDLILLAAASIYRESDRDISRGQGTFHQERVDPYEEAVRRAKALWATVLKHRHDD